MNKRKKFLAVVLSLCMTMGLMPLSAWATAAQVIVEPSQVYWMVYAFDANNTADVMTEEGVKSVTATDAGLVENTAAGSGLTVFYDDATGLYGYKDDATEAVVIAPQFDDYYSWSVAPSETIILVGKTNGEGIKYGGVDRAGNTVIPFQYDYMYSLYGSGSLEGYVVSEGEKEGVLSKTGTMVVPAVYDNIWESDTVTGGVDIVWASLDGKDVAVSTVDGQPFLTVPEGMRADRFNGTGLVPVVDEATEKVGYMDTTGTVVVPAMFDAAMPFVDSMTYVAMEDADGYYKYAVMNNSGVLITDYIYSYPDVGGGDGLITVEDPETHLVGYMNEQGQMVVPAQYAHGGDVTNGVIVVTQETENGYYQGLIDVNGGVVLPCQYDDIVVSEDSPYFWVMKYSDDYDSLYGLGKLDHTAPSAPPAAVPAVPAVTAYPTSYPVLVDGVQVAFDVYALKDPAGNDINYFKLRDVANVLNGTAAQFDVGWDGSVAVTTNTPYQANGSEMTTPFSGAKEVSDIETVTLVDGAQAELDTITLVDDANTGYTYYKIRDLGEVCGFNVTWNGEQGCIEIDTTAPYADQ